jgi:hypothetical protein
MEFYDLKGNYSYKLLLKTNQITEGRWTNEVIIDEVTLKVYTTYIKNGICYLYEIDLNTGDLNKILAVYHPFPEKIRVYDGYLFYLYDLPERPDNKMLYKQKI